ncbi:hypothetical protein [Roseiconus lacunae]|uniref:Cobalt transporter n=1 Tax=Roseiconus lacunae TaxID=2605694 RepID=A0ABT7PDB2_9BACT|nr:hypothetical protein [Roseiconus lacunae]MCD0461630.1 hypothetical protein [Roseiconus lacunae]MDM4014269.1 hypothetical protein [Roseiconus lacunae]WRQ49587.1 hypothetical protein U8335_21845 [Stieleria sp. HD01]
MTKTTFTFCLGILAAFSLAIVPGCGQSSTTTVSETETAEHDHEDGHDHGDHAGHDHGDHDDDHSHDFKSIDEVVAEVTELNKEIAKHMSDSNPSYAHGALHHVGEVLIAGEEMVAKMDDSETKAAAKASLESLINDFTAVDDTLHTSDENVDPVGKYNEVKESIQKSIDELSGVE